MFIHLAEGEEEDLVVGETEGRHQQLSPRPRLRPLVRLQQHGQCEVCDGSCSSTVKTRYIKLGLGTLCSERIRSSKTGSLPSVGMRSYQLFPKSALYLAANGLL